MRNVAIITYNSKSKTLNITGTGRKESAPDFICEYLDALANKVWEAARWDKPITSVKYSDGIISFGYMEVIPSKDEDKPSTSKFMETFRFNINTGKLLDLNGSELKISALESVKNLKHAKVTSDSPEWFRQYYAYWMSIAYPNSTWGTASMKTKARYGFVFIDAVPQVEFGYSIDIQ